MQIRVLLMTIINAALTRILQWKNPLRCDAAMQKAGLLLYRMKRLIDLNFLHSRRGFNFTFPKINRL